MSLEINFKDVVTLIIYLVIIDHYYEISLIALNVRFHQHKLTLISVQFTLLILRIRKR